MRAGQGGFNLFGPDSASWRSGGSQEQASSLPLFRCRGCLPSACWRDGSAAPIGSPPGVNVHREPFPLTSCCWIASASVKHGRRASPLPPPSAAAANSGVTVSAAAFPSLPTATSVPSTYFQIALLPILPGRLRPAEIPGFWVGKELQLPGSPRSLAFKILACFFGRSLGCWRN